MSSPQSSRSARLIRLVAAIAAIALVVWIVDSLVATRVEARLSSSVERSADLDVSPDVFVGGYPYTTALLTGEIPRMTVDSLDINVDGLGIVNASTQLNGIEVTRDQVLSGDVSGAPVELYTRTISLDGVAFGQLLGITDLDIANPSDISPGGGVSSEAQLTGTPDGFDDPITVLVALRLDGPDFHMTVRELSDVPAGREDDATDAFTYSMDTRELPLSQQATLVQMSGGSIMFETQRQNITLRPADLAPLHTEDEEWEES